MKKRKKGLYLGSLIFLFIVAVVIFISLILLNNSKSPEKLNSPPIYPNTVYAVIYSCAKECLYDLNNDFKVNSSDIDIIMQNRCSRPGCCNFSNKWCNYTDVNSDNRSDTIDISIVRNNIGKCDKSCKYDINNDTIVNDSDIDTLMNNRCPMPTCCNYSNNFCNFNDVNKDGKVDTIDISIVRVNKNVICGDGFCSAGENFTNCPYDCQIIPNISCRADNSKQYWDLAFFNTCRQGDVYASSDLYRLFCAPLKCTLNSSLPVSCKADITRQYTSNNRQCRPGDVYSGFKNFKYQCTPIICNQSSSTCRVDSSNEYPVTGRNTCRPGDVFSNYKNNTKYCASIVCKFINNSSQCDADSDCAIFLSHCGCRNYCANKNYVPELDCARECSIEEIGNSINSCICKNNKCIGVWDQDDCELADGSGSIGHCKVLDNPSIK